MNLVSKIVRVVVSAWIMFGGSDLAQAAAIVSTWTAGGNGGNGLWNVAGNWNPNGVPNDGGGNTYNVRVDGGQAANSVVTVDMVATVTDLVVNALDGVTVSSGNSLTLTANLTNDGTVLVTDIVGPPPGSSKLVVGGHTVSTKMIRAERGGTIDLVTLDNNAGGSLWATRNGLMLGSGTITISGLVKNAAGATLAADDGAWINCLNKIENKGTLNADGGSVTPRVLVTEGVVNVTLNGGLHGESLLNKGTFTVRRGRSSFLKPPGAGAGNITNNGTITIGDEAGSSAFMSTTNFTNSKGATIKIRDGGTFLADHEFGEGTRDKDPSTSINRGDVYWTQDAVCLGTGLMIVGGDFLNYSQQAAAFDMTAIDLWFDDPETINDPAVVQDSAQIFIPSPSFAERNASRMVWPSVDVTDPPPGSPRPTLYLKGLTLTPGPEDNPAATSTVIIDGQPLEVQNVTTLDVRGGVIYLTGPLSMPSNTKITDSLNPGRSLSDMVRIISPGQFPSNNFGIGSLTLRGADYVYLGRTSVLSVGGGQSIMEDPLTIAPNPTLAFMQIQYAVARAGRVRLELLDVSGRVAATLADRFHTPGRHVVTWDGVGLHGRLTSGVYFVHLVAPNQVTVRKLAIIQ